MADSQGEDLDRRKLFRDFLLGSEVENSYTLDEFKELFPRKYREHRDVKILYNAYQEKRRQIRDSVMENVIRHCCQTLQNESRIDDDKLEEAIAGLEERERLLVEEINTMDQDINYANEKVESCREALETRDLFSGLHKTDFNLKTITGRTR